jgi:hypothetical protein
LSRNDFRWLSGFLKLYGGKISRLAAQFNALDVVHRTAEKDRNHAPELLGRICGKEPQLGFDIRSSWN